MAISLLGNKAKVNLIPSPAWKGGLIGEYTLESALEFELCVWVGDADNRLVVSSKLHQDIDRRFREANTENSFPQRDLHLRSLSESVVFNHTKTTS